MREITPNELKRLFPKASASTIKKNEAIVASAGMWPRPQVPILKLSLSTDCQKLNKTESAYLQFLKTQDLQWIGVQNITLKLADDTRYTCDFFCIDHDGILHGREVKGTFVRDDAKVKIKVAARMFPWIRFSIVKKVKNGWEHTEVKP